MTPTPKDEGSCDTSSINNMTAANDGVVISGMAGLYPQARYIRDLENILYNKVNPVSAENLRWHYNHPEVAQYTGNVPELDRFDAQFFKVHYRLGNSMDSMSRKILEQTYEAIYDAGVNPDSLSGKKVGVYIGTCFSETEKACFYVATSRTGFGIAGCSKAMFANRISYWLNAKGPSVSIDDACCSSAGALELAYRDIRRGECEAAVVGGANLCLHPQSTVHYGRIMKTSQDGKTKSFDQDAAGCAKSEAINVLFLQKAKDAKRIYANVIHVKCEFLSMASEKTGPKYGFYRDPMHTARFLKEFYDEAGMSPAVVEYVEAFGSAIPEADKSELEAIDKVFCGGRKDPLLVGSVMSNIGYGEAASGISAVTKVLLGYHKGELAGNLHCDTPRRDVSALQERRMRIVTDNQHFRRTYAAVNCMSVTGVNAHILLQGHNKPKNCNNYKCNIPRLVTASGRQDSSVKRMFDHLKCQPINPEELALLHSIHETNIAGHLGKGFIVLDTNAEQKTVCLSEQVEYFDKAARPLWFVYSGMGSQWAGMGAQLMCIPIFAAAIERCHKVLEPKGIDIVHIITSPDKTIFDNILHSFVGIAAVQIGLTDVLLELGLVPDNIIGHSVGELGCAYADGCLTAEEMILSAYSRGLVSLETPFIRGSMAAVGLGFQQISLICPPQIEVACHNSAESCTISGPADVMRVFVEELTAKGIFAREVPCSNIAYHSRYIADAGPGLLKYLKRVIETPRARSERWVSTSVPQSRWNDSAAKYSSAEYHTNNLLSPVLFEETIKLIPANAVLVEVAPHGLLQAILKRALPDSCTNIPLTRRGHRQSDLMLLEAVGKLYLAGYNPLVRVLYPKVEFPVSSGTPYLSHYADWVHQEKWSLPLFQSANRTMSACCLFIITLHDEEYSFLKGHVIKNKTLVPYSAVLVMAWDTLAMSMNVQRKSISVKFQNVQLFAQPILYDQKSVKLYVSINRGNGYFEVMDGSSKVATGYIFKDIHTSDKETKQSNEYSLNATDVYRLLYEREYGYSGLFRSIHSTNESLTEASVFWNENWVTFIDGLLQLNTLKYTQSGVAQPEWIGELIIDLDNHKDTLCMNTDTATSDKSLIRCKLSDVLSRTRCGGVIINNIRFRNIIITNQKKSVALQRLTFVPRFHSSIDVSKSISILLQLAAENIRKNYINVIGLIDDNADSQIFQEIENIASMHCIPGIKINFEQVPIKGNWEENEVSYKNADIVVIKHLSRHIKFYENLHSVIEMNTYIVNEEDLDLGTEVAQLFPTNDYNIISILKNLKTQIVLGCWKPTRPSMTTMSVFTQNSDSDLSQLIRAYNNMPSQNGLIILTCYPPVDELRELVRRWRKGATRNRIHLIMVNEKSKLNSGKLPDINLACNIQNNGKWGGEYYLPIDEKTSVDNCSVNSLKINTYGDLNSLYWVQQPLKPISTGTLVTVKYAGINIGDVNRALGVIPTNEHHFYGMEFSGVTESGERVMGLVREGAVRNQVIAQPEMMWPVPAFWSLEDAATVPFAYTFAYTLFLKSVDSGRFKLNNMNSKSVLIHGGAGALGQAVISIALAHGYRVFTTVADASKKQFLMKLFPELNEKDIGNSRDSSFGDLVLSSTDSIGCNIVICCLKGSLKDISLKCCAPSSAVLDTSQMLNNGTYMFGMHNLTKERSYISVDLSHLFDPKSEELRIIHGLVSEGISTGAVRPLSRVTFSPHEAARAFRLLAGSRHRGRVLLRLHDPLLHVIQRFTPTVDHCHLVICDLNPLGLELVDKLIECGINSLCLHLKSPSSHLDYKLRIWKNLKIRVHVTYGNLDNIDDVTSLFQSAMTLGPVEGLHIVADSPIREHILANIDEATKSICPSLRYFLIVSKPYNGYFTSMQRIKSELPVSFLDISMLDTFEDADGVTWYRGAAEAMELALQSYGILVAQPKVSPRKSLLQKVAELTDIDLSKKLVCSDSLEPMGIPLEKSSSVCVFLKDAYNTSLVEEDMPYLTVKQIKVIEENISSPKFEIVKGLETFYSYVDSDELMATTEMVFLRTLTHNYAMRDDEFDVNETFLCIIPGLEGHHARFRSLCERLKLLAFVLQPGLDVPNETPREQAARYAEILLKKTSLKKTFYILGYETGVLVALEVASILEENGLTGTVYCLGSSPSATRTLLERKLESFSSEDALQEGVVRHMYTLLTRSSAAPVDSALRDCHSWSERVDACVRTLRGRVPHSTQYARALLDAAYTRITTARSYRAAPCQLRSRLVLLQATSPAHEDYKELQQYSTQPLQVHDLRTPIPHIVKDLQVPAIVNKYLDEEILQTFETKNLCESYLLNADAFMS